MKFIRIIILPQLVQGDFRAFLKKKGALKPTTAVRLALDIARSLSFFLCYLRITTIACSELLV